MELKTPLYEQHVQLGGKMVSFGGYLLPVTYKPTSLIIEHEAVRNEAGLFDVSHMGSIFLEGKDALENVQNLLSNDFSTMEVGQVKYTLMCNEAGGIVDDFIVYKYNDEKFMLVVNAANREKDANWIKQHLIGDCLMNDQSDAIAILALQGPLSEKILKKLMKEEDIPAKFYTFLENRSLDGVSVDISQTGYTGELGFEIYFKNEDATTVWNKLLEAGKEEGLIPCGLGARDTLRLEAGLPLYGNELTDEITPLEAKLKFATKLKKDHFIGKDALVEKGEPTRTRIGAKVTGKGIVREHAPIFSGEEEVGISTSGSHSPTLGYPIASLLIDKAYAEPGTQLEAEVRGRRIPIEVVKLPFYKREK